MAGRRMSGKCMVIECNELRFKGQYCAPHFQELVNNLPSTLTTPAPSQAAISPNTSTTTTADPQLDVPQTKEEKNRARRKKIAEEMLSTEVRYVDNLQILCEVFIEPFQLQTKALRKAGKDNMLAVFFSTTKLLYDLNQSLLQDLKSRVDNWSDEQCLGDIFCHYAPLLKLYAQYAKNHELAIGRIRKHQNSKVDVGIFQAFLDRCHRSPRCGGQTLESLLICPIQRVPRYKLLLDEYLKRSEESHPDYPSLQEGLSLVQLAAQHINETIRRRENREKLEKFVEQFSEGNKNCQLVTSVDFPIDRVLVKEETLNRITRRGKKRFHFHLFTDLFLYSEITPQRYYKLHRRLELMRLKIQLSSHHENAFEIISTEKSFVVCCENPGDAQGWVDQVQALQEELKEMRLDFEEKEQNFAAMWATDSTSNACTKCNVEFTMFNRRHHCRKCGALVCHDCSKNKLLLPNIDAKNEVRVDDDCYNEFKPKDFRPAHDFEPLELLVKTNISPFRHQEYLVLLIDAQFNPSNLHKMTAADFTAMGLRQEDAQKIEEHIPKMPYYIDEDERNSVGDQTIDLSNIDLKTVEMRKKQTYLAERDPRFAMAIKLLEKEGEFVKHMEDLYSVFVCSLLASGKLFDKEVSPHLAIMAYSIEPLITLNKHILDCVEKALIIDEYYESWPDEHIHSVAALFQRFVPLFALYYQFALSRYDAVNACDEHFAELVLDCQKHQKWDGKPLQFYLQLPVARIDDYQSFLHRVLLSLSNDHVARDDIKIAYDGVIGRKKHIEELIAEGVFQDILRSFEAQFADTLHLTQHGRRFRKQGSLQRVTRKGLHEYYFHLFSDLLLYSDESPQGYKLHRMIDLTTAGVTKLQYCLPQQPHPFAFQISSPEKSFVVVCQTELELISWITEIATCCENCRMVKLNSVDGRMSVLQEDEKKTTVAAVWQSDDTASNCPMCHVQFSLFTRRHHCRACGTVCCSKCSGGKKLLAHISQKKPQRVCDPCLNKNHQGDTLDSVDKWMLPENYTSPSSSSSSSFSSSNSSSAHHHQTSSSASSVASVSSVASTTLLSSTSPATATAAASSSSSSSSSSIPSSSSSSSSSSTPSSSSRPLGAVESSASKKASTWVEYTDPASGRLYYYNIETKQTSWSNPDLVTDAAIFDNHNTTNNNSSSASSTSSPSSTVPSPTATTPSGLSSPTASVADEWVLVANNSSSPDQPKRTMKGPRPPKPRTARQSQIFIR